MSDDELPTHCRVGAVLSIGLGVGAVIGFAVGSFVALRLGRSRMGSVRGALRAAAPVVQADTAAPRDGNRLRQLPLRRGELDLEGGAGRGTACEAEAPAGLFERSPCEV
jgi:hypothetical protein